MTLDLSDDERWELQRAELMKGEEPVKAPRKAPPTKLTYVATDPAGKEHSIASGTTVFSHLVVILPVNDDRWQLIGWCRDEASAQRLADQQRARGRFKAVEILPTIAKET